MVSKTEKNRNRGGRPKGHPKTGGRKPGTPNKVTLEARLAASEIVDDPIVRANLLRKARKGLLHPSLIKLFWEQAHGKAKDQIELTGANGEPLGPRELVVRYLKPGDPVPEDSEPEEQT